MSISYEIKKYDYLDWLRGFAILGTIFAHIWTFIIIPQNLGVIFSMWVPLFFIISAFTLSLSYSSRSQKEKNPTKNFFIRRFFRIYPLFIFVTISIFIWVFLFKHYTNFIILMWDLTLKDLFLKLTFTYWFFPETQNNMYMWEWSLFNEFWFYIFFPFLFIRVKNKKINFTLWLLSIAFIIAYLSNILAYNYYNESLYVFIYYSPITTIFPFMLWIMLFKVKDLDISRKWLNRLAYLNLASFVILGILMLKFWRAYISIPFCLNLALMLFLFIKWKYDIRNKILAKFFKFTWEISYSLYLLNFSFIFTWDKFLNKFIWWNNLIWFIFLIPIILTLFLVSFLTYKFIEQPWIKLGKKIIEKNLN
jgi:peptidoglycan/LPS O-acetylase OafA/YrhL